MHIQPYLFFEGRCDEAIAFYQQAVGAEVQMLMRFSEAPAEAQQGTPPDSGDKVMHAALKIGGSVMMSDGRCGGSPIFGGFSLSLAVTDQAEAQRAFAALDEAGQAALRKDLEQLWADDNKASDGTTYGRGEYLEVVATRA